MLGFSPTPMISKTEESGQKQITPFNYSLGTIDISNRCFDIRYTSLNLHYIFFSTPLYLFYCGKDFIGIHSLSSLSLRMEVI